MDLQHDPLDPLPPGAARHLAGLCLLLEDRRLQAGGGVSWKVSKLHDFISGTFPLCLEAGDDDQWVDGVLPITPLADLLLSNWSPSFPLV